MNQVNYQKELEKVLSGLSGQRKKLLLHSCCAPCSSYVLEYLGRFFDITVLYFNPNITDREEYRRRVEEQGRLIDGLNRAGVSEGRMCREEAGQQAAGKDAGAGERTAAEISQGAEAGASGVRGWAAVSLEEGRYDPALFFEAVKGLERIPEGGERCFRCYELRLRETARRAAEQGYDYFTTTLTISPLKNAGKLNEIGFRLAEEYGVAFLPSDFKKKNGYRRSVELSEQYSLYRQDYCGCVFSKAERDSRRNGG